MNDEYTEKLIKKYNKRISTYNVLFYIVLCSLAIYVFAGTDNLPTIAAVIMLIVLMLCASVVKFNIDKYLFKLLGDECNPKAYFAVRNMKNKSPLINNYDILYMQFIGDYKRLTEICSSMLSSQKAPNIHSVFPLERIIDSAFLCADYDFCLEKISEFFSIPIPESIKASYANKFNFYSAVINNDFEKAGVFLDNLKRTPKQKHSFGAVTGYYTALLNYKMGNKQTAKIEFESVKSAYPYLYVATLSECYINCIENDTEFVQSYDLKSAFESGKGQEVYTPNSRLAFKSNISRFVLIIICIIFSIIGIYLTR